MDVTRLYRTPNPAALRPSIAPKPEGGSPVRGLGGGSPRGRGTGPSSQRGLAFGRGAEHGSGDMAHVQDPLTVLAAKEAELLRGTGDWHNIQVCLNYKRPLSCSQVSDSHARFQACCCTKCL